MPLGSLDNVLNVGDYNQGLKWLKMIILLNINYYFDSLCIFWNRQCRMSEINCDRKERDEIL